MKMEEENQVIRRIFISIHLLELGITNRYVLESGVVQQLRAQTNLDDQMRETENQDWIIFLLE